MRYGVLCLLALFIIILLTFKNYETWTAPLDVPSEKAAPKKTKVKPEGPQSPGDQKVSQATPSVASYIFVAEKNPFHPDRKEFPVFATAEPPKEIKKPIVRPQVTLYGVTIAGDYSSASISYPGRPLQKGEREVLTVKVGDRVGEYKLAKILEDRIGLETPEDNFEILLYDAKAPKRRVYAKTENKPADGNEYSSRALLRLRLLRQPNRAPQPGVVPVTGGIAAAPMPTPLTPAGTPTYAPPSSRTRRFNPPKPSEQ